MRKESVRVGVRLEQTTLAVALFEGVAALVLGVSSSLISLTGFGIDSLIEVGAALLVLRHLKSEFSESEINEGKERSALRLMAVTFYCLAIYLVIDGGYQLFHGDKPSGNKWGILLSAASAVTMYFLSKAKTATGSALGSTLLVADGIESRICAWMAFSTFIGLLAYSLLGYTWVDSFTGLVIAAFALTEGREAWEGELVCED